MKGIKTFFIFSLWMPFTVVPEVNMMTCSVTDQDPFVIGRSRHYDGLYRVEPYQYRYNCKEGYEKPDRYAYAQCTINGWKPDPLCQTKEKVCNKPQINKGYIYPGKTTYNNEETIYYVCVTGYKPTTEGWWGHITCTDRAWSRNPKCIDEMNCGILPPIVNGRSWGVQRDEYSNGETVHVQCNTGYKQVRHSAKCVNGNWILPECTETGLPCKAPPRIENAIITLPYEKTYLHASKVTYKCLPLFTIEGKEEVECRNGNWAVLPRCIPNLSSCKQLPAIENGDTISNKRKGDLYEEATFQCSRYYKLESKRTVRCQNGNWEELPKCLKPCVIENIPEKHHVQNPGSTVYVEEGKKHTFKCKSEYYKDTWYWSTNVDGICKNGHMEFPTCYVQILKAIIEN
ncbi:complement factor H-related protein 1-like isoform X2 [Scleropages formosus]|uniref:complement factor H-related protein 1-like isoform X2 n=1 Tax=Scleropages formosus TaxID=113540 RepID=UPI0010FA7B21|nr:complement factor H-related protein 1-like isoform X2 [Scleropages formosus]